jgi:hypothetical protein
MCPPSQHAPAASIALKRFEDGIPVIAVVRDDALMEDKIIATQTPIPDYPVALPAHFTAIWKPGNPGFGISNADLRGHMGEKVSFIRISGSSARLCQITWRVWLERGFQQIGLTDKMAWHFVSSIQPCAPLRRS